MKKSTFRKCMAFVLGTIMVLSLPACDASLDETETETAAEMETTAETETEIRSVVGDEVEHETEDQAIDRVTAREPSAQGTNSTQTSTDSAATNTDAPTPHSSSSNNDGAISTQPQSTQPTQSSHQHAWVEQTVQVWHDEEGHYEDRQVANMGYVTVCNACAQRVTGMSFTEHRSQCPNGGDQGYHNPYVQDGELFGYTTQSVYVMDRAGYYETVITGYVCSDCGEIRVD